MTNPMAGLASIASDEIELGQVERELAKLWAGAADEEPGEMPPVMRACALNLVVLGHSADDLERARPIAARTTLANPSRILLLASDARSLSSGDARRPAARPDDQPPAMEPAGGVGARISAFCHRLGGGGRHVCCEEITLLARGSAAERLPEALLPLLLPDMPVHVWLPEIGRQSLAPGRGASEQKDREPTCAARGMSTAAQRIAAMADQVIWSARSPEESIPVAASRMRPRAVIDLDWMRALPWREMTAQLFDPPDQRLLLDRLEAVEVKVADPPAARPGAGWLWMGWLAARLGWELDEKTAGPDPAGRRGVSTPAERRLNAAGGPVSLRVTAAEAGNVASGELVSVRLVARGASQPLTLERQAMDDPAELCIRQASNRCVHLGIRDEPTLLNEALGAGGRDKLYEMAWEMAVRLWTGR